MNNNSIYIVEAHDLEFNEIYQYQYNNITHARIAFDNEIKASLIEYINGNYHLMDCKDNSHN